MDPDTVYRNYINITTSIKEVSKKVKELQTKLGLDELRNKTKELKALLYEHMDKNNLEEFNGIKITTVMPSDVKRELRVEGKKELIADVIGDKIPQEDLEDIIDKLVSL